ncbi:MULTISPECIES: ABC transporter ATP-binding protein [Bacteria]|uniref:ABC transporter ATP-binding protein n=1 Tax=Bacteria TaxID=2 RepID=UPI003C7CCD54
MTAPLPDSSSPDSNAPDETAEESGSPGSLPVAGESTGGDAGTADRAAKPTAARGGRAGEAAKRGTTAKAKATKTAAVKARATQTAAKSAAAKATVAKATAARTAAAKAAASKAQEAKAEEKAHEAEDEAARVAAVKAATPRAKKPAGPAPKASTRKTTAPGASKAQSPATAKSPAKKATPAAKKAGTTATTAKNRAVAAKRPLVRAENTTDVAEVNAPTVREAVRAEADSTGTAPASVDEGAVTSSDGETTEDTATPGDEEQTPAETFAGTGEPDADQYALVVRGLAKTFGDHRAVDGISLTVPAGSFYGIVGPNGAGKTTTLSIVAGLLSADEGTVHVCGVDQRKDPQEAKRLMGVLPDRLRTFDRLTGRQLLHYYGLLRGLAADVVEKRTADLARAFDLTGALGRVVSDYSAGMTKKVMLAGAMIHSPRVLVLDEPFESVDPVSSGVILDILGAYVAHGGTVILSSHGMDLVERVCSRIAIIVGGEVLAEGTVDEVRAGQTLEQRFVELSGGAGEVEGLEWLHAFSD